MIDFYKLLKTRRSIRQFQDKKVPLETIREIIQRPFHFILLEVVFDFQSSRENLTGLILHGLYFGLDRRILGEQLGGWSPYDEMDHVKPAGFPGVERVHEANILRDIRIGA